MVPSQKTVFLGLAFSSNTSMVSEDSQKTHGHPVRAVALDIGNVLLDFEFSTVIERILPIARAGKEEILEYFRLTDLADEFERGHVSPDEFHGRVCSDLGLQLDFPRFRSLWNDIFRPHPGMFALAERVSEAVPLLAASNTNLLHQEHFLALYPVFGIFTVIVTSCDIGVRKPEAAFFKVLAGCAELPPERILFVDDIPGNVEGARLAGFKTHLFHGPAALEVELRRLGVL